MRLRYKYMYRLQSKQQVCKEKENIFRQFEYMLIEGHYCVKVDQVTENRCFWRSLIVDVGKTE